MRTLNLCFIFIFGIFSIFPIFAEMESTNNFNKGVIEKFDLEAQSITIQGQAFFFSNDVKIRDNQNHLVGFRGLEPGLLIEFSTSEKSNSYRQDLNPNSTITQIKLISIRKAADKEE